MNTGKFSITTAIPYVNASPHVGFAMELIQADVLARYERLRGREVFFLTGTDENALKNVQAAEQARQPVRKFVDEHTKIFADLPKALRISNDDFIRTTEERHRAGAQKLWKACEAAGDIYKKKYRGLYCVGCEEFKTEKDLAVGLCPEHRVKPEEVEEENYFFRLSKYQNRIEQLIASGELRIVPETKKNEALSFAKQGLQDISISRSRERAKNWGIPVPGDESQIIYVWYDALTWFINSLGYATDEKRFNAWWNNGRTLDLIGKGINRFHTIYWPAMLISAGIKPPTEIYIHGYITVGGEKMSKSLGNTIDPFLLAEKYGADALRFYLLREIPSDGDGDFSISRLETVYNADLSNGLGNFAARVLALAGKDGLEIGPEGAAHVLDNNIEAKIRDTRETVYQKIEEFKLHEALAELWSLVAFGDAYVNREAPWKLGGAAKEKALFNLVVLLDNIAAILKPFLPETSEKITKSIEWRENQLFVKRLENLFPRLKY